MRICKNKYSWYALYTKSRCEKKLYQELKLKGIECFLPLKKELREWSDRSKWVEEPLIRCYLFVKVSEIEYYEALNSYYAVRYIGFGGKAVPIPESQLDALKIFMKSESSKVDLTHENLEKGELVEVAAGPLKGVWGEIIEIRGKQRIVIRFESLGTCIYTDVSLSKVKRIQKECV